MLSFGQVILMLTVAVMSGCGLSGGAMANGDVRNVELPTIESNAPEPKGEQTAVFAGGCFWGVEAVFESMKGVIDVKSGYSGGTAETANYDMVSDGETDHAEAVIVRYDPTKVTYIQLLSVFFSVVHDPTEVNRQGPDIGRQYRSAIFYADEAQKKAAEAYIKAIDDAKVLKKKVATQVVPLVKFYDAEEYHQNYLVRNPTQPYIVAHDLPKLEALKKKFPDLYVEKK
ncbi:MAG: peptide-methionine (S)-S-oxide reductase MsrA [Blastocatellia bacterium]|nr:peptide-methionine (S)-S-oxide reductase MsrA [Blastocatellia bacterium]